MTAVDQLGYCTISLTASGDQIVSVRLGNIKTDATDADVYAVAFAIASVLDYPIASILRSERTLLNA